MFEADDEILRAKNTMAMYLAACDRNSLWQASEAVANTQYTVSYVRYMEASLNQLLSLYGQAKFDNGSGDSLDGFWYDQL